MVAGGAQIKQIFADKFMETIQYFNLVWQWAWLALLQPENGRFYLWSGFIAALLIFITAVFGAIILYTRKRAGS